MQAPASQPLDNDNSTLKLHRPTRPRRAPPSQDRPFTCPVPTCSGRFHRKFTLREHLKTHTGEQPHQCPVERCGKRFSTSGNLARHRKLHAVHKLNCPTPQCSREFTDPEKLTRHLKVHLAGTSHTCTIDGCNKTFSTSGNLTRHCRTRHHCVPRGSVQGDGDADDSVPPLPIMRDFTWAESQEKELLLPVNNHLSRMRRCPVVPGAMLVKAPMWYTTPVHDTTMSAGHQDSRLSDQDVRDLLDCLFVKTLDPVVMAAAPVTSMDGIIRSEPFLRGAYHHP
uniref:C2H2-type domain-containing protein n=1 Tax=Hyaloperonospora arabidopsidis (strain Emoy2) TaxID=559515 RepID=M4BNG3_HYAAE